MRPLWHRTDAYVALISVKTRRKRQESGGFVALFQLILGIGQAERRRASHRLGIGRLFAAAHIRPAIAVTATGLLLLPAAAKSRLPSLRLRTLGHQDSIVVLCMLEIVLRHHAVALRAGISGKLQVLLVDMRSGAADLHVGSGRIEGPVVIVLRPPAASP